MGKTTPKSVKKKEAKTVKHSGKAAPKKDHKKVHEKKPALKAHAKPAAKASTSKAAPKKPEKKAHAQPAKLAKPALKKAESAKKPVPSKSGGAEDSTKLEKTTVSASSTVAKSAKGSPKKKVVSPGKKEEFPVEDDLVGEGDDFSNDELSEYQAELESAEEESEEKEGIVVEEATAVAPVAAKEKSDDIILTDAEGRRYCRVKDCDQVATVDGYCRYHYLLLWKKIQVRKKILADGKLERYIEELTSRYPDKFLEVIRRDLRTEKDFVAAIQEMEIDDSGSADNDYEDESSNFIEEVRGASPEGIADDDEY